MVLTGCHGVITLYSSLEMHQVCGSLLAISASFVGIDIPCEDAVTPPALLSDPQPFNERSP